MNADLTSTAYSERQLGESLSTVMAIAMALPVNHLEDLLNRVEAATGAAGAGDDSEDVLRRCLLDCQRQLRRMERQPSA